MTQIKGGSPYINIKGASLTLNDLFKKNPSKVYPVTWSLVHFRASQGVNQSSLQYSNECLQEHRLITNGYTLEENVSFHISH